MKKAHNFLKNFVIILFIIIIFNIFSSNNKVLSNNYLMEKEQLLDVLQEGDSGLWQRANQLIRDSHDELGKRNNGNREA